MIFFSVVFRQLIQHLQRAFGQRGAQVAGHAAVLQDFTGDVQRQIVGIDQAAHEAQVVRHKLLGVVHDEHTLDIQLQAVFMIAVPHIPRRLRRDIQQAGVLLLTFHAVVAPGQRVAVVVSDMLIKLFVFVVVNFGFAAGPQGLRLVDFFPRNHGFAVFLFPFFNLNRQRDMVGILADDRAHAPVVEEIIFAFAQMQGDFGAAIGFGDISYGIFAFAGGFPEHAVFRLVARRTGTHGHFVRHDEGRIEADAELTDQLAILRLVRTHRFEERFGAGFGDGAEMVDNLFPVHTDTVIGDGQGAVVFIKRNPHAQLAVSLIQIRLRQRAETQLIGRIRGVGNQLTQKDFFVGIEGMDHQVQKLLYF